MGLILDIAKFVGIITLCVGCIFGMVVGTFMLVDALAERPTYKD